jgi:hypothetical protein
MLLSSGAANIDERTDLEKKEFRVTLEYMNLLYLSCSVVCLIDLQYKGRFWTCFEVWLSFQEWDPKHESWRERQDADHGEHFMQPFLPEGRWLREQRAIRFGERAMLIPIASVAEVSARLPKDKIPPEIEGISLSWANVTIEAAIERLKQEDLFVTNKKDRKDQLDKIRQRFGQMGHIVRQVSTRRQQLKAQHHNASKTIQDRARAFLARKRMQLQMLGSRKRSTTEIE